MLTCISNPPYNMKWDVPVFAQTQERFNKCSVPPSSNANYAFILTALEKSDRAVFILPCGVLSTNNKDEKDIKKYLVKKNFIEAIIMCPDNMFEATSIPVCLLVLDKKKVTTTIEMINLKEQYEVEIREQNGQFGGNSHTKRTYKKDIKVFTDEIMDNAISCIKERKNIKGLCKSVQTEEIEKNDYILTPTRYIPLDENKVEYRSYKDIVNDLNRVIKEKNTCKLTINETLAKSIGFDLDLYKTNKYDDEFEKLIKKLSGSKIEKDDYFKTTKNKNEVKFENNSKESISSIFMIIFNIWKQHIYYLNNEENRYLAELRDKLLPELMNGNIDMSNDKLL